MIQRLQMKYSENIKLEKISSAIHIKVVLDTSGNHTGDIVCELFI